MENNIFTVLLISLCLTLVLELIFALAFKVKRPADLLLIVLVNLLTNPPTVLGYYLLKDSISTQPVYIIILLELEVVVVEWICYKYCTKSIARPLLFALGANAFSYIVGLLISKLF